MVESLEGWLDTAVKQNFEDMNRALKQRIEIHRNEHWIYKQVIKRHRFTTTRDARMHVATVLKNAEKVDSIIIKSL